VAILSKTHFHTHECANTFFGCNELVSCPDTNLERNHDGFPEIICYLETIFGVKQFYCEACENVEHYCSDCGAPEHLLHEEDCIFWERDMIDDVQWAKIVFTLQDISYDVSGLEA
jgi:hypothetical protein